MKPIAVPWWSSDPAGYRKTVEAQRRARRRRQRANPTWQTMTARQRRGLIFALNANGLNASEIARLLLLSRGSVDALLKRIWGLIHFRADARFPVAPAQRRDERSKGG